MALRTTATGGDYSGPRERRRGRVGGVKLTRRNGCGWAASGSRWCWYFWVYERCRKRKRRSRCWSWRSIAAVDDFSAARRARLSLPLRDPHARESGAACGVGEDSSSRRPSGLPRRECPVRWAGSSASCPGPPYLPPIIYVKRIKISLQFAHKTAWKLFFS